MDKEGDDGEFVMGRGKKYRPVVSQDNDRSVLEMSSLERSNSASSTDSSLST